MGKTGTDRNLTIVWSISKSSAAPPADTEATFNETI